MFSCDHARLYAEKIPRLGWYITSIYVDEGFRNQGVGSALLRKALADLPRPVYLFASPEWGCDVKRLKKFYKRFGFIPYKKENDIFPYKVNMILIK